MEKPGANIGAMVGAAYTLGMDLIEYAQRRAVGLRWCWRGQHWVDVHNLHKRRKGVCIECERHWCNEKSRAQRAAERAK